MIADIEFLFSHDSKEAFYLIPVEWIHTCVINFAIKLNLVGGFANITENRKIMCARSQSTCVSRLLFSNALILDRTTRIGWNVSPPLTARPTSTSPTVISGWSLLCFGRRERNEKREKCTECTCGAIRFLENFDAEDATIWRPMYLSFFAHIYCIFISSRSSVD